MAKSQTPQSPRELLKRGKELYFQGHYGAAADVLEQISDPGALSKLEASQLRELLDLAHSKQGAAPAREQVIARAQSPQGDLMTALKAEAARISKLPESQRLAAARKWVATGRVAFNQGDLVEAEEIAQLAGTLKARFPAREDSPETLLAEITEFKKQEAAWKKDSTSAQAKRNRVNYLLRRTIKIAEEGDLPAAERLLASAEKISVTPGVLDVKPAQVREMLNRMAPATPADGSLEVADASAMDESAFDDAAAQPAGSSAPAVNDFASDEFAAEEMAAEEFEAGPATGLASPNDAMRARADRLLNDAKVAAKAGRLKEAVKAAQSAATLQRQAGIQYGEDEESPAQYLAALQSKLPSDAASLDLMEQQFAATEPRGTIQRTTSRTGVSPDKKRAQQLLAAARSALDSGRVDEARSLAMQASKIKVTYDLAEENPHQLLADVDAAVSGDYVATAPSTTGDENPFEVTTPRATQNRTATQPRVTEPRTTARRSSGLPAPAVKQQALDLLAQARADMKAGRLEDARKWAEQAQQLNTVYSLLDDRPDLVLADIELASANGASTEPATTARNVGSNSFIEVGPAAREPDLAKQQASLLIKQSRLDLQAGNIDQAREKALEAQKLGASYSEFEDRPESVLQDITQMGGTSSRTANDSNPFEESAFPVADKGGTVADANVIHPTGAGAMDLYRQGRAALQRRDRETAYHLFLQAYQSGERLEPRMQQQLQDFLTELAPKNKVRTVSAQVAEGDPTGAGVAEELATDEASLKINSLRTQVQNSIFRAERMRDRDPEGALKLLDAAQREVELAQLPEETASPLIRSVSRQKALAEASLTNQAGNIEQKRHNEETKTIIKQDVMTKVRIEQQFADYVQNFNDLLKQRRYAEAEVIAKKAQELDPENPVAETMKWKATFAKRVDSNNNLKDEKEKGFWEALDSVEHSAIPFDDRNPYRFGKDFADISARRKGKYGVDNKVRTEEEKRIERSLSRQVSLHFDNEPLSNVIRQLATTASINIQIDQQGLDEEHIPSDTPVTIHVDGIQMRSALNLILENMGLGYAIRNEVLNITSRTRQQGELESRVYNVADLVIGIPNFGSSSPYGGMNGAPVQATPVPMGGSQMNVSALNRQPRAAGQTFAQVQDTAAGAFAQSPLAGTSRGSMELERAAKADFDSLIDLITSTIEPNTWDEVGGQASVRPFETTLSLVIRQTEAAHEEIQDLLLQLRRLQDLQVAVEVRFVTVSDQFFERIGIDFDFNMQGTAPVAPNAPGFGDFLPPFGRGTFNSSAAGTTTGTNTGANQGGQNQGQNQGGQNQGGQNAGNTAAGAPFVPGPQRDLVRRGDYPKLGTIVGMDQPLSFSQDLEIPFRQGSFQVGVPDFGGFNPDAGIQMGFAILSDIETFFFIQAAQGDSRSNILFAPKVTLFNGQTAFVTDSVSRPFVVGQTPVVGAFSVGFQPNVQFFTEGVTLTVLAVVSADRRYVRLAVVPDFRTITDVFTFSFQGGSGTLNQGGGNLGGNQNGGGNLGGGGGGLGGLGGLGGGGIGGGGGQQGGGQQGGTNQGGGTNSNTQNINFTTNANTQTVQQPIQEIVQIQTAVSVPDGGTVLLGGIKRLREGRNMSGVPILNKIPYVSRLFKNSGVGRETDSLMMMVTPRIIIQEEEEELLGIPL